MNDCLTVMDFHSIIKVNVFLNLFGFASFQLVPNIEDRFVHYLCSFFFNLSKVI